MNIEILGTGCSKCKKTEQLVRDIVKEQNIDAEISRIEDLDEIVNRGVKMTPAIAVDGDIKFVGHVPSKKEIQTILK